MSGIYKPSPKKMKKITILAKNNIIFGNIFQNKKINRKFKKTEMKNMYV